MTLEFRAMKTRYSSLSAVVVLLVCLVALGYVGRGLNRRRQERLHDAFVFQSARVSTKIHERLLAYAQILRSGAAFFAGSDSVEREEWRRFVGFLHLDQAYRGIQGVGFTLLIPKENLRHHLEEMRQGGFPGYIIKPSGEREVYTSIIYLEPFSGRNLRAFGYDMLSEAVRKEAMWRACDSGDVALSGRVQLLQETQVDVQAGALAYYPVYINGLVAQTVEQRRGALFGWVYSPYRMKDLLDPIVDNELNEIRLEIFEGGTLSQDRLLYDSHLGRVAATNKDQQDSDTQKIDIGGRFWSLRYTALAGFGSATGLENPATELTGLSVIGFLLCCLTGAFINTRRQAKLIAANLSASLRHSEARFTALFSEARVPMLLIDAAADGRILEANHSAADYYGYAETRLKAMCIGDINTLTRQEIAQEMDRAEHQQRTHFYFKHRLADGQVRDVEVHSGPIELSGQRLLYSIILDITERKHAESLLSESEKRFRAVADAAPVLIWIAGTDKLCNWVNQERLKFTGRSLEQELGNGWAECVHPDDFERCLKIYFSHFDHREPFRMKYRLKRHDGEYRCLDDTGVPRFDADGVFEGYIGSCMDVTEQMVAQDEISKANKMLQSVLSAATEISIIASDADGLITIFNRGSERILGYPCLEIIGKQTPALFHLPHEVEQRAQELTLELHRPVSGFETFVAKARLLGSETREWTYVRKDASTLVVSLVVTTIRDPQGEITGYLGIAEDISERKQVEQALQQASQAAESLAQSKSEFLANMSHEIRTPMSGIMGLSQLALNKEVPTEVRDYLEKIHSSAKSLLGILNDILDFSKMEAGKLAIDSLPFNLGNVLDNLRNMFSTVAAEKNLDFSLEVAADVPADLVGDAPRIQQVLSNLLGNAVKFTERGKVGLRATLLESAESRCRIGFSVSDSGIGISRQDQDKLFQPFGQADTSITRRFGGTGLGLAISYKLLQLMGSDFQVESTPGRGSTFRFELWLSIAPVESRQKVDSRHDQPLAGSLGQELREQGRSLSGTRVLVAEDNHINQQVVKEFLQLSGVVVDLANNGKEALQLLEQNPYDVVLMDIHMPEMGGIEATERIRQQGRYQALPIIALTAGVTQKERDNCMACGMQDFVTKPISPELLMETLTKWIKPGAPVSEDSSQIIDDWAELEKGLAGFELSTIKVMLGGRCELMNAMLNSFLTDFAGEARRIVSAVELNELATAEKLLHRLKGTAGSLGARDLYQACQALEVELKAGQCRPESLQVWLQLFDKTMVTLATVLQRTGSGAAD